MTFTPRIFRWDPTWIPETAKFFPMAGAVVSTSKYTGSSKASLLSNSPWAAQFTMPIMHEDHWGDIEAMLVQLDGPSNWVRLFHPLRILPRGVACGIYRDTQNNILNALGTTKFSDNTTFSDGTVFSEGGTLATLARTHYRGEKAVLLTGLVASQASSIMRGDMMEIGGYLYMAVASCASDANGKSLVPIRPALRADIPVNSADNYVQFAYATSPFLLASTNYDGSEITSPDFSIIGLQFVEALP